MYFSLIIPVFNRPLEVDELLASLLLQSYTNFEVIIIEDGSTIKCDQIIAKYQPKLKIKYYYKSNSGPGLSRNYGANKSKNEYYIFCDSDCIFPPEYFYEVQKKLKNFYTDAFGGPDKAHDLFSPLQKAINYAMTSFLTTGGIRGGKRSINKFQPRSFNMGISRKAFQDTGGFGNIHPGEDPDLTIRLWEMGYKTQLITDAYVFHKRRISWIQYYKQVNKFGKCRPILNYRYPHTSRITYWFPTFFILFLIIAIGFSFVAKNLIPLYLYIFYFVLVLLDSTIKTQNIKIGIMSIFAVIIQYFGYGLGFLKASFSIRLLKIKPENAFPELFF